MTLRYREQMILVSRQANVMKPGQTNVQAESTEDGFETSDLHEGSIEVRRHPTVRGSAGDDLRRQTISGAVARRAAGLVLQQGDACCGCFAPQTTGVSGF